MRKQRGRAWRRAQNKRIVRKRRCIVKDFWLDKHYAENVPNGLFRKWNFTCNCWMCKMSKDAGRKNKRKREISRSVHLDDYY